MISAIADRIKTITAANGFVPFISRVWVDGKCDGEAKSHTNQMLSVSITTLESDDEVEIHLVAEGLTETQLRHHIDAVLAPEFVTTSSGTGQPITVTQKDTSDAIAEENTDDSGQD